MPYSERVIGFSTGALAKGGFLRALPMLETRHIAAVELSALREEELPELARSLDKLDLSSFAYVSVHAPTRFALLTEEAVVGLLEGAASRKLPIVVHPDTIQSPDLWRRFGGLLLVENMDKRKSMGRTSREMKRVFDDLPEARLCFDVAHTRQVDPTMTEAAQMLRDFQEKIHEIHASGVSTRSAHGPISAAASFAYSSVAHLIPETVPIILESPVSESMIDEEVDYARAAFSPWLNMLRDVIDGVLDLKVPALRRQQIESFLRTLRSIGVSLTDFDNVVLHLPYAQEVARGGVFLTASDLLNRLSGKQKSQLEAYLVERLRKLTIEFPDLRAQYAEQFSAID